MEKGFIKIYRSLTKWQWYTEPNTMRLYLHLLLTVSIKDSYWQGILVKRGSRVSSIAKLAEEIGLTARQTRTSLQHLISTNDVTKQATPNYTVFTVVNYDRYQSNRQTESQTNDKRPTNKATNHESNERQQYKNNKKYIRNLKEGETSLDVETSARSQEKTIFERMRE